MARTFTFDLPADKHTWYENAETGAIVQAFDGTAVPALSIVDVDEYVAAGLGALTGSDDQEDAIYFGLLEGLRDLLLDLGLELPGPREFWSLEDMKGRLTEVFTDDTEAIAAYAALHP
jgi:hypothetical protein